MLNCTFPFMLVILYKLYWGIKIFNKLSCRDHSRMCQ